MAVEKPLGLTVRAGLRTNDAAERAGKVLSVFENYRLDPMYRLARAILDGGALGSPRLALYTSISGTRYMPVPSAWRHLKHRGGYLLDYAVHTADLLMYFMGEVDRVYAETHLWEPVRYLDEPIAVDQKPFYRHRVREEIERGGSVEVTSEDMAAAVLRFKSGAVGQIVQTIAAPGAPKNMGVIYCDDGSIRLPRSRTGGALQVTHIGKDAPLAEAATLELVPEFRLDENTERLFGGHNRLSSYDLSFDEVDRKLVALELEDFAEAIRSGGEPEVTGRMGLDAVALIYSLLESGHLGQAVSFADVAEDRVNAYQQEINDAAGL